MGSQPDSAIVKGNAGRNVGSVLRSRARLQIVHLASSGIQAFSYGPNPLTTRLHTTHKKVNQSLRKDHMAKLVCAVWRQYVMVISQLLMFASAEPALMRLLSLSGPDVSSFILAKFQHFLTCLLFYLCVAWSPVELCLTCGDCMHVDLCLVSLVGCLAGWIPMYALSVEPAGLLAWCPCCALSL